MKIKTGPSKINPTVTTPTPAPTEEAPVQEAEKTEEVKEESPVVEETKESETPVAEEPKEEVKEESTVPIVVAETKSETVVQEVPQENMPLQLKFLKAYIDEYKKCIAQPIPDTAKCNETFEKLMRHAIKNQDTASVVEELYSFFMEKKSILLKPSMVLTGIPSSKRGIREKIQIAYMLMYELVSGSKGPFDFEYAAKILEGTGYVNFIRSRIR